jgi:hypothetical protein
MSYTLNIEPEIIRDAEVYAKRNGTTLEQFVRACVLVAATQKDMADTGHGDVGVAVRPFCGEKPRIADMIGYGAKFHTPRSTEEWMKELREGEEE